MTRVPIGVGARAPQDATGSMDDAAVGGGIGRRAIVKLVVSGIVVGFLAGLFGVGGGFVIVPALVTLRFEMVIGWCRGRVA